MLASYLKQKGVSALALGRALNVSHTTVLRWAETGVPAHRLADLARITGLPAAALRPDLAATFQACHQGDASEPDAPHGGPRAQGAA